MKIVENSAKLILLTLGILLLAGIILSTTPVLAQESTAVLVLNMEGPLTPAMSEYLARGITTAEQKDYQLIILQLNTPGGSVTQMQQMVSQIRGSRVPIVIYIAPSGAIAGSAGTVVTLAGHRAAMAPETAIGAASPVGMGGEDLGETVRSKTEEIIKAQIRSLASRRGPEAVAFAEQTVENAKAASAVEALEVGLIDYLAEDFTDLFNQLEGERITMQEETITLRTRGVTPDRLQLSLIEQLLQLLTNPNIVFILITIGAQAILIELSNPGVWVPGFVGAVSLALAGYGLGILPVNWFGIIFLIIAFVLFALEIKAPTLGALTAAGVASLITGALVLFNSPGTPGFQRVSIWLVVAGSLFTGGMFAAVMSFAVQSQKEPVQTGKESLLGKEGFAKSPITTGEKGQVQIAGERWSAALAPGEEEISSGDRVVVTGVRGLQLQVQKKNSL